MLFFRLTLKHSHGILNVMSDIYLQEVGKPLNKQNFIKILTKFRQGGYRYWVAKQQLLDFITFAEDDDLMQLKAGNLSINKFYRRNPHACIVTYSNNRWVNLLNLPNDVRNCIIRDFNKEFNSKTRRKYYQVPYYPSEDCVISDVENSMYEWYELNGLSESKAIEESHDYLRRNLFISNNMNPFLGYNERFCWFK